MKTALFAKTDAKRNDPRLQLIYDSVPQMTVYQVWNGEDLLPDTDMILSVGGDGTFLSAASMACRRGIPVLGVNLGRMGFLSEYTPAQVARALREGDYIIEERQMLRSDVSGGEECFSLNEVSVNRGGAAMLGIDVRINGRALPTYWADGLLVATSSGSTAYSLSAGGPICTPDAQVLIITPIAPHNLNVRPLIVPSGSSIEITMQARDGSVLLTRDNTHEVIAGDARVHISVAQFSLKRLRLAESDFIGALRSKLFWGEDVRNAEI